MGLDMYLSGEKYFVQDHSNYSDDEHAGQPVDTEGDHIESARYRLGYWRKFAPLHQFIVDRFAEGKDECQTISLSAEDLHEVADTIEAGLLPPNQDCGGFFFGNADWWDEMRAEAKEHAAKFRAAAVWVGSEPKYDSGHKAQWRSVYYRASW